MSFVQLNSYPNHVDAMTNGNFTSSNAFSTFDISGNGEDASGTFMYKIAPIGNTANSFYTLISTDNNFINGASCIGYNIIRVENGSATGVGYINNPTSVNAFTCDTSGNLWVGADDDDMSVYDEYDEDAIENTSSLFYVKRTGTIPVAVTNTEITECKDLCPIENFMFATVKDVSGTCHNYAASGNNVTVGNIVFPRLLNNNAQFNIYTSPDASGTAINANMDLSGHRLVAFNKSHNDISGVYVVRSNSSVGVASTNNGATAGDAINIAYLSTPLGNMTYDSERNKLHVVSATDGRRVMGVPLDVSSNVINSAFTVDADAKLLFAPATNTTVGAVDASGFIIVSIDPSEEDRPTIVVADGSGNAIDTLTLLDVSGVSGMATTTAYDASNNYLYNYLFLIDSVRNPISGEYYTYNNLPKLAQIKLTTRSNMQAEYSDGSGVTFVHNYSSTEFTSEYSTIRDIRTDACGNIYTCGRFIYVKIDNKVETDIVVVYDTLNIGGGAIGACVNGAYTSDQTILDSLDTTRQTTDERVNGFLNNTTFETTPPPEISNLMNYNKSILFA